MAGGDDRFIPIALDVAKLLWGEPNKALSSRDDVRWGKKGARSLKVSKGAWFDQERKIGGGVLSLIEAEVGAKGEAAFKWLIEQGFPIEDRPQPSQRAAPRKPANGHHYDHDPRDDEPMGFAEANADPVTARGEYLPPGLPEGSVLAKVYPYVDEQGATLFEVCRYEAPDGTKTFRQRRKDGDRTIWSVKGVRQIPYRLPDIVEPLAQGVLVFIVEGEKDVDNLQSAGIPATCNAMGAGKWPAELNVHFRGADVVILPDADEPGRKHGNLVGSMLKGIAKRVRVLDLPGLPPKGDATDWLQAGHDAGELYDLVQSKAVDWTPDLDWKSHFNAVPWANLDDPGPEHEWLIKGLLTRGERSMCAGVSQSGKSFFALDLALSVARGVSFFGRRTIRGGVVYQAGEGGRGIKKRLRAYRKEHDLKKENPPQFVLLPTPVDLYGSDDHTDLLIDETLHWARKFDCPLELVVIDTLSAATPGANENASNDMSQVLARCAKIADATKAHVLLVHHMNASGEKTRGHSSIFANLDSVITIKIKEGHADAVAWTDADGKERKGRPIRTATVTKQKDGEDGAEIEFVLKWIGLGFDAQNDSISSCVIEAPDRGVLEGVDTTPDERLRLKPQQNMLLQAIHTALDEYGEPAPADVRLPSSMKVVKWARVREEYERIDMATEGDAPEKKAETIRKAMQRQGEYLLQHKIMGKDGKWVWLTGKPVVGFRPKRTQEAIAEAEADNVVELRDLPLT
jgi:RecA-family ATPase